MEKSLKGKNLKFLVALLATDVGLAFAGFRIGVDDGWTLLGKHGFVLSAVPLVAVLLGSFIPSDWKAKLVYWRWKDVLPGHRAFTVHGAADERYQIEDLRNALGALPSAAKEQNSVWYKLLKQHESQAEVGDTHQRFLLFRDAAAMSVMFAIVWMAAALIVREAPYWVVLGIFVGQYGLCAIAARNTGVRLVQNVLAIVVAQAPAGARVAQ